jgi:uncharacterized protein
MSGTLPSRINPFRLVEQDTRIEGVVPLVHMRRLGKVLLSPPGEATVSLHFARDASGLSTVVGEVRTLLEFECQRCLRPVAKAVERRFKLALARHDGEALRLQAEHEVLEVEDETVFTRDLVEDELLLSVPLIPIHDDPAACDAVMLGRLCALQAKDDDDAHRGGANPFAVLKGLKVN